MLELKNTDQNGFSAPITNKEVAAKLERITNDYDLLSYVKHNISFFMDSQLIDAEWFSRFEEDILKELNIFTSGYPCVEVKDSDFSAVVINCNLDLKTFNDAMVSVRFFGKSYGSIFLNAGSSATLKVRGTSTLELYASDHSQAVVSLLDKSRCFIEAHKNSFVAARNRTRGTVQIDKGTENVIIN